MSQATYGWVRVRRNPHLEEPRVRPPSLAVPYLILLGLCAVGMLLTALEIRMQEGFIKTALEHTATAFIVAAVIGLSYERVLHNLREAQFQRLFVEHREKTFEAIAAILTLTSSQVFVLLGEIAAQIYASTGAIPTLYKPSREDQKEYGFTESLDYFDTLLKVDRDEIIDALTKWVHPNSAPGLKFLGSDFIGRYRLRELADTIREQSVYKLRGWKNLPPEEKGWVLNFAWAASRCEDKMYSQLAQLIRTTDQGDIREWILFIPLQMKDSEFLQVLDSFLEREEPPTRKEMPLLVRGLGELYTATPMQVEALLTTHRKSFNNEAVLQEIRRVWASAQLSPDRVLKIVQR